MELHDSISVVSGEVGALFPTSALPDSCRWRLSDKGRLLSLMRAGYGLPEQPIKRVRANVGDWHKAAHAFAVEHIQPLLYTNA